VKRKQLKQAKPRFGGGNEFVIEVIADLNTMFVSQTIEGKAFLSANKTSNSCTARERCSSDGERNVNALMFEKNAAMIKVLQIT
jgi:hypothetical protein